MKAKVANPVLPMIKEIREVADLSTVVSLLNTGDWIVFEGLTVPKSQSRDGIFFAMGRVN